MNEIKVLPIIPQMNDATSFYRGQLPLADLHRKGQISLIYVQQVTWATMSLAEVCFMQRPFTDEHKIVAELADKMGRPLWLDFDDDLFAVPEDNRTHAVYSNSRIQNNVATMVAMADAVTVSTPALKIRYDDIRKRAGKNLCVVVPNALSDHFVSKRKERYKPRRKAIYWRGSDTHTLDLLTVGEPVVQFMRNNPDWSIHFMGFNPVWITSRLPKQQCVVAPGIDILDYHTYIGQTQSGVMIVPLHDSPFNWGKSNIAWIEGTYGHSEVIAPAFPEWDRPGILQYGKDRSFLDAMHVAKMHVENEDCTEVDRSWDWITKNLMLSQVNERRAEVLRGLAR